MEMIGKLPNLLMWLVTAFIVNPAITNGVREATLSAIDPTMPFSALMALLVTLMFNPITGFGIVAAIASRVEFGE